MDEQIEKLYCDIFENISPELEKKVKELCQSSQYNEGETIFCEGELSDTLYIVLSGVISLSFTIPLKKQVKEIHISNIQAKQVFGYSAVTDTQNYSSQAIAKTDCELLYINGQELRILMDEHPSLGYQVMKKMLSIVDSRLHDTRNELRWWLSSCL